MITYKYYDSKKRRLALLAFQSTADTMNVISIACSRKDAFSKKAALKALEKIYIADSAEINGSKVHPTFYSIEVGSKPYKDFISWANENFYRFAERRGFTEEHILVKPGAKTLVLDRKLRHKL